MAERNLIYHVKIDTDPKADAALSALEARVAKLKSDMDRLKISGAGTGGGGAGGGGTGGGKPKSDDGDLMKAIAAGAKEAEQAEKEAAKMTDALNKQRQAAAKELAAAEKAAARESAAGAKEAERAQRDLMKAIQAGAKEAEAAGKVAAAAEGSKERAAMGAANAHAVASAQMRAAERNTLEGIQRTLGGVMQLSRAFALSGVIGEENMKKVVDVLLKTQVAIDLVRGGMDVYMGLRKMVDAYRAAVIAATAAEAALGVARAASAAAGGKAVAGAAAGVATAAASGASGAVAIPLITKIGGAVAPLAALAAAGTAAVAGITALGYAIHDTVTGQATWITEWKVKAAEWVGAVDLGTAATKKLAEAHAKAAEHREQLDQRIAANIESEGAQRDLRTQAAGKRAEFTGIQAGIGARAPLGASEADFNAANRKAALLAEQTEFDIKHANAVKNLAEAEKTLAENQKAGLATALAAGKERDEALMRLIDLELQHGQVVRRNGEEAIRAAREELKLADDKVKKSKEAYTSDVQKFLAMNSFERQAAESGKKKLDQNLPLTHFESKQLGQMEGYRERIEKNQIAKAEAVDPFGVLAPARQAAQRAEAEKIKLDTEVKVRVEHDTKIVDEIMKALGPRFDQLDRDIEAAAQRIFRKAGRDAKTLADARGQAG